MKKLIANKRIRQMQQTQVTSLATFYKVHSPSNFSVRDFQSKLQTDFLGRYLYHVHETTSTMDLMDTLSQPKVKDDQTDPTSLLIDHGAPTGFLVLADRQTKGKGRKGRAWTSEATDNIYMSLLIRLEHEQFQHVIKLNLAIAVAIAKTCHDFGVKDARIKWPNDIWVPVRSGRHGEYGNYRKISGMLVNSSQFGREILANCGIGLNVNENIASRNDSLSLVATSLRDITGRSHKREDVLASICNHLEQLLGLTMNDLLVVYKEYDLLIGKKIMVLSGNKPPVEAIAVGYSQFGQLQVEYTDGTGVKELISEEISIRF